MKKRMIMLVALGLVLAIAIGVGSYFGCKSCGGCAGCSACSNPPELADVYDRVVELIEASKEINSLLYGEGLPVYSIGSEYANYHNMYEGNDHSWRSYEIVSEYAKFMSETDIKEAAERVYTKACLAPYYTSAFDGWSISDSQGGIKTDKARYGYEGSSEWFGQNIDAENGLFGTRIYDYSTIRIIPPGTPEYFHIEVNTWMENSPEKIEIVHLSFELCEDGLWYLDVFTG